MIITNKNGIYFDEKREDVINITFRAMPKIIANIQVLKFTYKITNNLFPNLLRFDEHMIDFCIRLAFFGIFDAIVDQ